MDGLGELKKWYLVLCYNLWNVPSEERQCVLCLMGGKFSQIIARLEKNTAEIVVQNGKQTYLSWAGGIRCWFLPRLHVVGRLYVTDNSQMIGSVAINNRLHLINSKMIAIDEVMFRVVKQVLGWQSIWLKFLKTASELDKENARIEWNPSDFFLYWKFVRRLEGRTFVYFTKYCFYFLTVICMI